ncbi:Zn-ribbon-containing, possibly RNA-binding protein and nonfunctional derivative [Candidatus Riesia pediculischaeffi PTSU]|uniref:Zn-ribbon-containing, possibly RNA-binding protein and nonfunctional derivative n=1 Tax=Candidatus Riesia pediculischaeffi PTSU TaxID=1401651 RepID=A0A0C1RZR9_9ENTR|nr:Zn-ribbon-containing, possibly RNA-binding protein and nonfunctional derivative [Candidatus Riesia pediculischaeffi PTSU]
MLQEDQFRKSKLKMIHEKAKLLIRLNKIVLRILPKDLKNKCRVANYRDFILILEVINASRKMRLCFELPLLIKVLKDSVLPALSSIHIIVNPYLSFDEDAFCEDTYCSLSEQIVNSYRLSKMKESFRNSMKREENLEIQLMKLNYLLLKKKMK